MGKEARARETQTAQHKAATLKKRSPAAYKRQWILGWSLVSLGVIVALTHILGHGGVVAFAPKGSRIC